MRACRLGWGGQGAAAQYLQVRDGGIQPVQPGPGCSAGVDALQLLPDGGQEAAELLQVIQQQDHAVVTHWAGGQVGRVSRGWGATGLGGPAKGC